MRNQHDCPCFFEVKMHVAAVVMVGESGGATEPVAWVQEARRAAALDLIEQLARQPLLKRIVVVSPDPDGLEIDGPIDYVASQPGPVHVGRYLAEITELFHVDRLLYFGGGSAPLLDNGTLEALIEQLATAESVVITNNQFASDWAGIVPASILDEWTERLPQDNMLGWVLSAEAGLAIQAQPPSAASRLDIDTPTDLLTLSLHPGIRSNLRRVLGGIPLDTSRLKAALGVLATPASQAFIAGRLGPEAWLALNKVTHCWLRVISEERGMVSSGRLARGEVYSMLAEHLEAVGLASFFAALAEQKQAACNDTRVILAHHRRWPSETDRFASDLGLVDQVEDPLLRDITAAALEAPIPVVLGGHGLLSGDLFAFCDLL